MENKLFNKKIVKTHEGITSYLEGGEGPCMVFIHGYMETKEIWLDFAAKYTISYKVIIVDIPGYGESTLTSAVNSMDNIAAVIYQILVLNKISRAIFIGHSMGGYVSLALLDKYPSSVKAIVMINSISSIDDDRKRKDRIKEINLIKKGKKDLLIKFAIPNSYLFKYRNKYKKQIKATINKAINISNENLIAHIMGINKRPDRSGVLLSSKLPYIMIHGKKDAIFSEEIMNLNFILHKSNFIFVSDSAHMSFIENKLEIQNLLNDFFAKIT